jgi:hypothetical protein
VIAVTRKPKPKTETRAPVAAPPSTPQPFVPSAPEPIPKEPPFGPLRVENAGLPCDVDEVLANKCRRCHGIPPRHSAPFPLYTHEHLTMPRGSEQIYEYVGRVVASGFMPYRIEANPPIELLTDAEKKTLLDWVGAGAPRGSCEPTKPKKKRANAVRPRSSP